MVIWVKFTHSSQIRVLVWTYVCVCGFPSSSAGKETTCSARDPVSIPGSGGSPGEGTGYSLQYSWASLPAQLVKNPPAMWETWVLYQGWEDPLEKGTATHSSVPAWRISRLIYGLSCGSDSMCLVVGWRVVNKRKVQVKFNPNDFHTRHIILSPLIKCFSLTLYTKLIDWFITSLILYLLGRCKALDKQVSVLPNFV